MNAPSPAPGDARSEDRRARRLAQAEFRRPLLLEAGAGTGKTTTLVARILAWCLGPGWRHHAEALAEKHRDLGRTAPPAADEIASEVLERVVAITFTEDAAAEMARRVAGELGRLTRADAEIPVWLHLDAAAEGGDEGGDGAPSPDQRAHRAAALLATLDRLVVRTIHAFCRGLLADHPLEARLHPELAVDADGLLLEEVARETVESNLRRLYGRADADGPYLALAARGVGPRELVEALVVLSQAGVPADALDAEPLARAEVARLGRRLADACSELHELAQPRLGAVGNRAQNAPLLCSAVGTAIDRLGGDTEEGEADGAALLGELRELVADLFPDNLRNHLKQWQKWNMGKAETSAFDDIRDELAAAAAALHAVLAHLERLDPELLALSHRALAPLHRQVRDDMRARGVVTFEDLLTEAARLLADRPGVAAGVRGRIDQLLVDEFQDTDALQCEIVAGLGLEGPPERRPGLFLVGDPKQSIYGWRSADLAAYDGFRRRVQDAGGEVLPLVENFRSVPAILDEVERAVEPVMLAAPGVQPPFQPLLPCDRLAGDPGFETPGPDGETGGEADAAGPRRSAVEHWVAWRAGDDEASGAGTSKTHSYEVEAAALACDIRHLHDAHAVPWDRFAILLRSTTDLDLYLEALRGRGVPFAVGRDKQYYRRREVIDAAALVRAVLDPGDHLALLTVLRSPWVGVPDAALVPLWNRGFPDLMHRLVSPRRRLLDEAREMAREAAADLADLAPGDIPGLERVDGWELSLAAGVAQLAAARQAFREEPADTFVAVLRHLFLPEPVAAARYLGAYRLANLERFFRRLVTALEDGGGDVTAVLRALRRSVAEARDAPEGKPREGAEDAVQVMTIHQAKGLDFSHVYLPQLHKDSGGREPDTQVHAAGDPLAAAAGDAAAATGSRYEMKLFGAPSLGYDRVEARRARVEAAERVRLLYVAMTRAEHRLVLSGGWDAGVPDPREPDRARHFLDLLAHRDALPDPPPGERWQDGAADFADGAGALWRFPALTHWPSAARRDPEAREAPDPERVGAGSRELERLTRQARIHRDRPFSAPASEESHHLLREAQAGGEARGVDDRLGGEDRPSGDATPAGAEAPRHGRGGAGGGEDRRVALTVGTAVHRLLEELDLDVPDKPADQLRAGLAAQVHTAAEPGLGQAGLAAAVAATETLVERMAGGRLLARLADLSPHLLGREVPILVGAPRLDPEDAAATADAPGVPMPPVAYYSGSIDLLYRDPADGRVVIADYKTDDVTGDAVDARAIPYSAQGAIYAEAIQRALALDHRPRFELWFLRADRVVTVDLDTPGPPSPPPAPPAPSTSSDPPPPPDPEAAEVPPADDEPPAKGGEPRPAEQISLFDLD